MKVDIYDAVIEFFETGKMPRVINCTTVTLLSKIPNPAAIKDYRPISCCSVLFKIIAKLLASRLQKVMSFLIDEAQAGFIPGRKGADNTILAHELIRAYSRKHISLRCMIKVDLQKAYDSVEWSYVLQIMEGLGFPHRFTQWVTACIQSVSYSILINGELVEPFLAAKGLRQGDPMSPFLFALAMEYLSRMLAELKNKKQLYFHPKCKKLGLTHLSFADDLLLFAREDKQFAVMMK